MFCNWYFITPKTDCDWRFGLDPALKVISTSVIANIVCEPVSLIRQNKLSIKSYYKYEYIIITNYATPCAVYFKIFWVVMEKWINFNEIYTFHTFSKNFYSYSLTNVTVGYYKIFIITKIEFIRYIFLSCLNINV